MYKLIIADDEEYMLNGLTQLIDWNELGFEIVGTFGNGEEVIEFLECEPVDVILTDVMMPYIDGIGIAKYVNEAKLSIKVVLISGHKEFEHAYHAIKYGVEDYLLKPSKVEEVKKVFQKIRKDLDDQYADLEYRTRMEKSLEEISPLLAEKFINGLIMGVANDKSEIMRRMHLLFPEGGCRK